jgi:hypothetical protein
MLMTSAAGSAWSAADGGLVVCTKPEWQQAWQSKQHW